MSTKLIILTEEAFIIINQKLEAIDKTLKQKQNEVKSTWLDNQEFMQLLKISRRTAQSYRDNNMIAFSIIGNKIYYKLTDVEELLDRHYQKRMH